MPVSFTVHGSLLLEIKTKIVLYNIPDLLITIIKLITTHVDIIKGPSSNV